MSRSVDCERTRVDLLDYQRGRLDAAGHAEVAAHLESCAMCAREDSAEHALTEVLERRLPQHAAPLALKRRLAAQWPVQAPAAPPRRRTWVGLLGLAAAVVALVLVTIPLYNRPPAGFDPMVREAVNDHLRIVASQNPLEIKSGGIHQVKPWFAGRLDFAPVVRFGGDADYPLQGGAVGYFLDEKAAVFVFARRLHPITLVVFPAGAAPWPTRNLVPMGRASAYATSARGFNVILWRDGELGYALVSDVDARELARLGERLAG